MCVRESKNKINEGDASESAHFDIKKYSHHAWISDRILNATVLSDCMLRLSFILSLYARMLTKKKFNSEGRKILFVEEGKRSNYAECFSLFLRKSFRFFLSFHFEMKKIYALCTLNPKSEFYHWLGARVRLLFKGKLASCSTSALA